MPIAVHFLTVLSSRDGFRLAFCDSFQSVALWSRHGQNFSLNDVFFLHHLDFPPENCPSADREQMRFALKPMCSMILYMPLPMAYGLLVYF